MCLLSGLILTYKFPQSYSHAHKQNWCTCQQWLKKKLVKSKYSCQNMKKNLVKSPGMSSEVSWRSLRSFVLENATCSMASLRDDPDFCDRLWIYNDRSRQSKTNTGKLWLNGVAKFLTSLTKVKFLTFFKSTEWFNPKSSVYFKWDTFLLLLLLLELSSKYSKLIHDLCQIPANPVLSWTELSLDALCIPVNL